MTLRDWLNSSDISTATPNTPHSPIATIRVATAEYVADVAIIEWRPGEKADLKPTVTYSQLIAKYPKLIEGCLLTEILTFTVEDDYEQLMDKEVMICLAKTLLANGKIATIATHE